MKTEEQIDMADFANQVALGSVANAVLRVWEDTLTLQCSYSRWRWIKRWRYHQEGRIWLKLYRALENERDQQAKAAAKAAR